jgi:hypothetical protein
LTDSWAVREARKVLSEILNEDVFVDNSTLAKFGLGNLVDIAKIIAAHIAQTSSGKGIDKVGHGNIQAVYVDTINPGHVGDGQTWITNIPVQFPPHQESDGSNHHHPGDTVGLGGPCGISGNNGGDYNPAYKDYRLGDLRCGASSLVAVGV